MTALITNRPLLLNANTLIHGFWDLRSLAEGSPGPGVADRGSFKVIQRQSGAGMAIDVGETGIGLQRAWVRGSTRIGQGLYQVDTIDRSAAGASTFNAQLTDTITTADLTNPRIDRVVMEIKDQQHDAGGSNLAQIRVVPGTPTAAVTLDTADASNGAAAVPTSCLLLADVLVGAGVSSILTANIRDRRPFPLAGSIPPLLTDVDAVAFEPAPGLDPSVMLIQTTAAADGQQAAALMYRRRPAKGITKIKLRTQQGATANLTNSTIAIFDASGRLIRAATTPAAFGGTANQLASPVFAITSTDFEAGYYYVFIGNAAGTASGSVLSLAVGAASGVGVTGPAPNMYLFSATGGTTVPTNLLGFTDEFGITGAAVVRLGVPLVVLSK